MNAREPAGRPTGGQFAASRRDEATVSLDAALAAHRAAGDELAIAGIQKVLSERYPDGDYAVITTWYGGYPKVGIEMVEKVYRADGTPVSGYVAFDAREIDEKTREYLRALSNPAKALGARFPRHHFENPAWRLPLR